MLELGDFNAKNKNWLASLEPLAPIPSLMVIEKLQHKNGLS